MLPKKPQNYKKTKPQGLVAYSFTYPFLYSLTHSLTQQTFTEYLLCARCGERVEGGPDELPALRKLTWGMGADSRRPETGDYGMLIHTIMKIKCDNAVEKGWARLLQTQVTREGLSEIWGSSRS